MANAEPGLNEILNVAAQTGESTGTPAVQFDNKQLLQNLNDNARFKAENDWRKYNSFLGNLKEVYSDLSQIQGLEVATQDREMLRKQTGEIFKEIADNPRAFFGGAKMGDIQAKIGNLKSLSTESKMNQVYDFAHRQYIAQNPDLNTEENKKQINEYWKQPLGKRSAYTLNLPTVFDARSYGKEIMGLPSVTQKFAQTGMVGQDLTSPGNEFVKEIGGNRSSKDAFMKQWMAGLNTEKDKYGHSIRGAIDQQFNQLPDNLKKQFGSAENFFYQQGLATFGSDKDIVDVTKSDVKPNEFAKLSVEQKQKVALESIKFGHDKQLEYIKHDLSTMPTPQQTQFILGTSADILNNTTGEKLPVNVGGGKTKDEDVINAAAPIKELFAKKIKVTTKEGLTTESASVTSPDVMTRTSSGNIRNIFYKKDASGNVQYDTGNKTSAEIKKEADKAGVNVDQYKQQNFKPVIEDQEEITPRQYMTIIGKHTLPEKELAGVVNQADNILKNKFGDNLINYSADQNKQQQDKKSETKQSVPTPKDSVHQAKMPDGSMIYSNDGKTWYNKQGKKIE